MGDGHGCARRSRPHGLRVGRAGANPLWALLWALSCTWLAGCTGADDTFDPDSGDLQISALEVVEAEGNPLACWLRWTTNQPADSHVEFGGSGTPRFRVGHEERTNHHEVLVYGLRAEWTYTLEAISETVDGEQARSTPESFTSGPLPGHVTRAEVRVHDPDLARDGWTLFDNFLYDEDAPDTAVIVDMEGYPVWVHVVDGDAGAGATDVRLTQAGTVLLGPTVPSGGRPREVDLAGEILWEGLVQPGFSDDDFMHHHMEVLEDDSLLTLVKKFVDGTRGDRIVNYDRDGTELWSWDLFEHLEPVWVDEWTHCNSLAVDGDDLYLSTRAGSEVIKLCRSTGEIEYRLSEAGGFTLDGDWFDMQHDPDLLGEDHLLIYDNGNIRETSRVIEVEIDPSAGTAEIVWEWPRDEADAWFTDCWGDADRLDNGNTLIAAGAGKVNRMTEVTPDGSIVWQAQWPTEGDVVVGFYRAQRIDLPGLTVLED